MVLNKAENPERIDVRWPAMAVPGQYARRMADKAAYGFNVTGNAAYELGMGVLSIPANSAVSVVQGPLIGVKTLAINTPWELLRAIVKTPLAIVGPPVRATGNALKKGLEQSWDIIKHPIQSTRSLIGSVLSLPREAANALKPLAHLDVKAMASGIRTRVRSALARTGSAARNYLGNIAEYPFNLAKTVGTGLVAPFSSLNKKGELRGLHGVATNVRAGFERMFRSFSTAKANTPRPSLTSA